MTTRCRFCGEEGTVTWLLQHDCPSASEKGGYTPAGVTKITMPLVPPNTDPAPGTKAHGAEDE